MATGKTKPMFLVQAFTYSISSWAANTAKEITAENLKYSIPSGYRPLGFARLSCGSAYCTIRNAYLDVTSGSMIYAKNQDSNAKSNLTVTVWVVFINNDLVSMTY